MRKKLHGRDPGVNTTGLVTGHVNPYRYDIQFSSIYSDKQRKTLFQAASECGGIQAGILFSGMEKEVDVRNIRKNVTGLDVTESLKAGSRGAATHTHIRNSALLLAPLWLPISTAWLGTFFQCGSGATSAALLFLLVVVPGGVAFFLGASAVVQNGTLSNHVRLALFLLYCPVAAFVLFFVGWGSLSALGSGGWLLLAC